MQITTTSIASSITRVGTLSHWLLQPERSIHSAPTFHACSRPSLPAVRPQPANAEWLTRTSSGCAASYSAIATANSAPVESPAMSTCGGPAGGAGAGGSTGTSASGAVVVV